MKGANDVRRGALFTKLAKAITLAAQQGGGDPGSNFSLRVAIDRAKAESMPALNIERAIKKGTGELISDSPIVSVVYEGYGPGEVAMLISCKTDNTNRAFIEVRQIMERNGGKLSAEGSVIWQFKERGIINIASERYVPSTKFGKEGTFFEADPEELILEIIEVGGVIDVSTYEDQGEKFLEVLSERSAFSKVHEELEKRNFHILDASLGYVPDKSASITGEQKDSLLTLLDALDEGEEVDTVWHNADLKD